MSFEAKKGKNKHRSHTVDKAIIEAIKDDMVGLNINIAKNKRAIFKAKTAIKGDTMQDIIIKAIDSYIET
ncbi:hypothetical protein [Candidatus Bandiella numerosa]|jgi:hypothetical protein|uniref:hypothetical protein n=1 Tax=Candidatus Bandiella numerosa TaxID=2570586 RepID=UPI001F1F5720|nr:hypothetical protein [Candidatus Bandiella numerosa]